MVLNFTGACSMTSRGMETLSDKGSWNDGGLFCSVFLSDTRFSGIWRGKDGVTITS